LVGDGSGIAIPDVSRIFIENYVTQCISIVWVNISGFKKKMECFSTKFSPLLR
jgi:hypothetical protein